MVPIRLLTRCSVLISFAGCTGDTAEGPECVAATDCDPGFICVSQACEELCRADVDCQAGEICIGEICAPGSRSDAPVIVAINGDGPVDGAAGHTANLTNNRLEITGQFFDGAQVTLNSGGADVVLEVCESATDRLLVELPPGLAEGSHVLTVASQAGSCMATLPVLQGVPGPLPMVSMGSGLTGTGTTMAPLAVGFGGNGVANTASRSDHGHGSAVAAVMANVSGACSTSGEMAFDSTAAQLFVCNGSAWQRVRPELGTLDRPAVHCNAILQAGASVGDGLYWLTGASGPFQTWCDMTIEGGGWTMFWYGSHNSPTPATDVLHPGGDLAPAGDVMNFVNQSTASHFSPPNAYSFLNNGWATEWLVRDVELDRYMVVAWADNLEWRDFFVTESPWTGPFRRSTNTYALSVIVDMPRAQRSWMGDLFVGNGFGLGHDMDQTACAAAGLATGNYNTAAHDYEECPKHILYSSPGANSVERGTIGFNSGAMTAKGAYFVR